MTPNLSLKRTARRPRLRAVRSRPLSLVRWASQSINVHGDAYGSGSNSCRSC